MHITRFAMKGLYPSCSVTPTRVKAFIRNKVSR